MLKTKKEENYTQEQRSRNTDLLHISYERQEKVMKDCKVIIEACLTWHRLLKMERSGGKWEKLR